MDSLIGEEDRPFVIKKIWCHGQSFVPPIIGIASLSYSIREPSCASGIWMGVYVPLVLCAWPFLSWKAVVEATATTPSSLLPTTMEGCRPSFRLWWGGVLVLVVYLSVLVNVGGCRDNGGERHLTGLGLLLLIFSALAIIETVAFLLVVATCLSNSRRPFET